MSYCVFLDIDGTIIHQEKPVWLPYARRWFHNRHSPPLEGAKEFADEVYKNGGQIIITTSRSEGNRKETVKQLAEYGIIYDQLIMDLNDCPRVIVNDRGPKDKCRAFACDLKYNEGVKNLYSFINK